MRVSLEQLANEFSVTHGGTKKQSSEYIREIFVLIAENLEAGNEISIPGFGKFKVGESKARTGRNPKTGEEIQITAKRNPKFLAAKELKTAINGEWS